ncbi:MAG: YraN family protein [Ruminococcaceae bacterium]|nr:YraN family protein [Oscillospiraceae bacterium]
MTKQIGDYGEDLAEKYLKKRGWRILSRNYVIRGGEIDIIGFRFGVLAYFEVKARKDESYGKPADAVDEAKIIHMQKTIKDFQNLHIKENKVSVFYPLGIELKRRIFKQRIDVIEVYLKEKPQQINHIKNWGSKL